MRRVILRVKKKNAIATLLVACSMFSFLLGMQVHAAEPEGRFRKGEVLTVETGLEDYASMDFVCLDTDYRGGYLFLAEDVIPYSLSTRYATSDNTYGTSDVRTWLNQYFADTLSVADELLPIKLAETDDSVSDRVFCLSEDEVKNAAYKEWTRKKWTPQRGMRYYWTRTARENTSNQAYMVQYNGQVASSRVSLTEAGIRPAFVIGHEVPDTSQGHIWYEGDTQERVIHGKTYTFRCIDPNYCDAGSSRAGVLFLCDSIIGGDESVFDEHLNAWEAADVRDWLNSGMEDSDGVTAAETTVGATYAGKSSNYQVSDRKFTRRIRNGQETEDSIFCLSLEEALRYADHLWKLEGSESDNFTQPGTHAMGYWLRTPAAKGDNLAYAVTYDGQIAPHEVDNDRIGIRPAFVAIQE